MRERMVELDMKLLEANKVVKRLWVVGKALTSKPFKRSYISPPEVDWQNNTERFKDKK